MDNIIHQVTLSAPAINRSEILRYAGVKGDNAALTPMLDSCLTELGEQLTYRVCYRILPVDMKEDRIDLGLFQIQSSGLSKNLTGCRQAVVFAATVGVAIDRLIARYNQLSPARALLFQAIGAERIESLCNAFCANLTQEEKLHLRPRFSPGYGDLPLSCQTDIIRILDTPRRLGLTLNSSLLMSPSKSVTAFAGIQETALPQHKIPCLSCDHSTCMFRSKL